MTGVTCVASNRALIRYLMQIKRGSLFVESTSIERVLLILTLLTSGSEKRARFVGEYCYLGVPMGVPWVPDGQYVASGLG